VPDDRPGEAAGGGRDNDREAGRDEQRVAQAQPARKPAIPPIESEVPASAANTTMMTRPITSVRLAPSRLDTQPTSSMATAVTTR